MQISSLPSRIAATEARCEFRAQLRAADDHFRTAASAVREIPRDESSDLDGPLGVAVANLQDGVDLLDRAIKGPAQGVGRDRELASAALKDASAAAALLGAWDNNGGSADQAPQVIDAASQLVESARRSLGTTLD